MVNRNATARTVICLASLGVVAALVGGTPALASSSGGAWELRLETRSGAWLPIRGRCRVEEGCVGRR